MGRQLSQGRIDTFACSWRHWLRLYLESKKQSDQRKLYSRTWLFCLIDCLIQIDEYHDILHLCETCEMWRGLQLLVLLLDGRFPLLTDAKRSYLELLYPDVTQSSFAAFQDSSTLALLDCILQIHKVCCTN